jgi:hypothetical protein
VITEGLLYRGGSHGVAQPRRQFFAALGVAVVHAVLGVLAVEGISASGYPGQVGRSVDVGLGLAGR